MVEDGAPQKDSYCETARVLDVWIENVENGVSEAPSSSCCNVIRKKSVHYQTVSAEAHRH